MPDAHAHAQYCERCGTQLLAADPAPLCASCWASDSNVSAPSLMLHAEIPWNGGTPTRRAASRSGSSHHFGVGLEHLDPNGPEARAKRRRDRRFTLAFAAIVFVALTIVIVPAAVSSMAPREQHIGTQTLDTATQKCVENLAILARAKRAGEPSPPDITCPLTREPYSYTQFQGVTTISCPNPAAHGFKTLSINTQTMVPVVN